MQARDKSPAQNTTVASAHYAEVDTDTIADLAGNPFAGISGSAAWSFTTIDPGALFVYTGPNSVGTTDRWNVPENWDKNAVPSGPVSVFIHSGKLATANSGAIPTYSEGLALNGELDIRNITGAQNANCTDFGNLSNLAWVRPRNNGIGPGGATINHGVTLDIAASIGNTIHDSATLRLHGRGRHDAAKLRLASSETIGQLWVDNTAGDGGASVQLPAGTYTATSSPDGPAILDILGNALIGGSGTLTVLTGPDTPAFTSNQFTLEAFFKTSLRRL